MGAFARYGSFPSPTTWYVTGGAWPGVSKQRDIGSDLFYLTQSLRMNRKTKKLELVKQSPKLNNKENIHGDEGGYSAVIAKTTDGGKTWTESMHDTDSASSLVAVHMLDENEVWVSGGHMGNPFEGRFWHSLDGGKTFTKEAIPGLYSFSFDMVSKESGFSVALTQSSGVQLLKYRDNKTVVMEWN
jgi:hypothetical protein